MNSSGFFAWWLPKPSPELAPKAGGTDPNVLAVLDFLSSDKGELMGENLVSFIATFYPPARILALSPKAIQRLAQMAAWALRSGLADGSLSIGPRGDIISKAWAEDPAHALNPDGTFKNKNRLGF